MGLEDLFSGAADLDDFAESNGQQFHISDVVQKSYLEVNEDGTEAAAASGGKSILFLPFNKISFYNGLTLCLRI